MKIARMTQYQAAGTKTKAFFDLETNEGITIKGLTLVEGPKGLFVSVPSDKGKDGKYYEKILLPQDMKKQLNDMALSKYDEMST